MHVQSPTLTALTLTPPPSLARALPHPLPSPPAPYLHAGPQEVGRQEAQAELAAAAVAEQLRRVDDLGGMVVAGGGVSVIGGSGAGRMNKAWAVATQLRRDCELEGMAGRFGLAGPNG